MADVISNTSPLQYLHQVGRLGLLPDLYGKVVVPQAVADELAVGRGLGVSLPDPAALSWAAIRSAANPLPPPSYPGLGPGELEVLALAVASPGSLTILDDAAARRAANSLGVQVTGTLGVLLTAKGARLLPLVRPVLDDLQRLGFRLSAATRAAVLKSAGE